MGFALIEPEGGPRVSRVTLPSLPQPRSARIIIDKEPATNSAVVTCFGKACTAAYEATPELVDKLKKGRMLQIQAVDFTPIIPFLLPLVDSSENSFVRANEGPPTDPRAFQEQQQKKRCPLCQKPWSVSG
jgi:hypothetical protein